MGSIPAPGTNVQIIFCDSRFAASGTCGLVLTQIQQESACLTRILQLPLFLIEFEVCAMFAAVGECHVECATGSGPCFVGLPGSIPAPGTRVLAIFGSPHPRG